MLFPWLDSKSHVLFIPSVLVVHLKLEPERNHLKTFTVKFFIVENRLRLSDANSKIMN